MGGFVTATLTNPPLDDCEGRLRRMTARDAFTRARRHLDQALFLQAPRWREALDAGRAQCETEGVDEVSIQLNEPPFDGFSVAVPCAKLD